LVFKGTLNLVPQASISTKTGSVVKQVGNGGVGGDGGFTIVLVIIVFNDASNTVYFTVQGMAP
jgi:hypothetical protein